MENPFDAHIKGRQEAVRHAKEAAQLERKQRELDRINGTPLEALLSPEEVTVAKGFLEKMEALGWPDTDKIYSNDEIEPGRWERRGIFLNKSVYIRPVYEEKLEWEGYCVGIISDKCKVNDGELDLHHYPSGGNRELILCSDGSRFIQRVHPEENVIFGAVSKSSDSWGCAEARFKNSNFSDLLADIYLKAASKK